MHRIPDQIAAFTDTGHSNANGEGINRVIKPDARATVGSATQRTSDYCAHAVAQPAESVGTSTPLGEPETSQGEWSGVFTPAGRPSATRRPGLSFALPRTVTDA
ncbi:hypothetical protein AB0J81_25775 [Streptomyces bobili]|uniref:hypothetical protein n=1 Tax=Streptomyces bobili TaxID=67280 RepID=UPI003423EAB1